MASLSNGFILAIISSSIKAPLSFEDYGDILFKREYYWCGGSWANTRFALTGLQVGIYSV
jgi:hypothetical protein